ncbi:hypothetical protein pb186bvf_020941 [Paramecium bursaria]
MEGDHQMSGFLGVNRTSGPPMNGSSQVILDRQQANSHLTSQFNKKKNIITIMILSKYNNLENLKYIAFIQLIKVKTFYQNVLTVVQEYLMIKEIFMKYIVPKILGQVLLIVFIQIMLNILSQGLEIKLYWPQKKVKSNEKNDLKQYMVQLINIFLLLLLTTFKQRKSLVISFQKLLMNNFN